MQKEQKVFSDEDEFQVLPELSEQESKKLDEEHRERLSNFYQGTKKYAIQYWYNELQGKTFQSHYFELTNLEAYVINSIYQENSQKLDRYELQVCSTKLIKKVDDFIGKHFPGGCFFKLSTRSPKDYSWRFEDKSEHKKEVDRLYKKLSESKLPFEKELINEVYRYFLQNSKQKIKIRTGKDFVDVFSHSERIQIDINDLMYLNNRVASEIDKGDLTRGDEPLLKVWGRKWVDCEWMQEFRCFYNNYQLKAISQFDQRCFFKQLQGKQQIIKNRVFDFFQTLKPSLKNLQLSSGVMDVIVRFLDDPVSVELIEINVFDFNTRGSLFSWQKILKLIQEGPLELRCHKQPIEISKWQLLKMMGMIERGIEPIVISVMEQLGYSKQWQKME